MPQTFWPSYRSVPGLLLAASLLGCALPPVPSAPAAEPDQAVYLQRARLALASYFEADASLADSQRTAGQRFATSQLSRPAASLASEQPAGPIRATEPAPAPLRTEPDLASPEPVNPDGEGSAGSVNAPADGNDFELPELPGLTGEAALKPESIDELVASAPASFARFDGTRSRFNRAAADFNARLLGADGLELDASGGILVNPYRLRAQLRADLHANADLNEPSLDLSGRLLPASSRLELKYLAGMGYGASASEVLLLPDGAESMLLTYRHHLPARSHQVRVISRSQGLSLRLAGEGRLGLRQVRDAGLSTELNLTASGDSIELTEQRFVNTSGAGAGFGSFVIGAGEQSYRGSLRSLSASDGRLMLMLEPDALTLGRLLMQQTGPGRVRLSQFDADGKLTSAADLTLDEALEPVPAASKPAARAT